MKNTIFLTDSIANLTDSDNKQEKLKTKTRRTVAYLLRALILIMITGLSIVILSALGKVNVFQLDHLRLAMPFFIYVIFAQAFVMFYFIGVSRLTLNIWNILNTKENLSDLFDTPPEDLQPYIKKTRKFAQDSNTFKRQTIPWTMLILTLGTFAFLAGGAHDTGLIDKHVHSGLVYGFSAAVAIGFFRQWVYLGKAHIHLRKIKALYMISDQSM